MRLFVALSLPESTKDALLAQQDALRASLGVAERAVRWVAAPAMHLTLAFLGEVAERAVPIVADCVQQHRNDAAAISLHLKQVGAFPSLRRPQTLWCGVGGEVAALVSAQGRVARDLAPLGYTPDSRLFSPHLTLGRVRREATPEQRTGIGQAIRDLALVPAHPWTCGPIMLFHSTLTPHGPVYTALETIRRS